jgi:hypothetical protein
MVSGALDWKSRFVEVGQSFPCILLGSRTLRWTVPGTALGDVVALLGFTWLLILLMWGSMWKDWPAPYTLLRSATVR